MLSQMLKEEGIFSHSPPLPSLTGVGFLRPGSIKSIKPGENKGDSTKHVAGRENLNAEK